MAVDIKNVGEVTKLDAIRTKIIQALEALPQFREEIVKSVDKTAPTGFQIGHNMSLQKYITGLPPLLDLSGCYSGVEVIDAAKTALENRKKSVEARLLSLGVDSSIKYIPIVFASSVIHRQPSQGVVTNIVSGGNGGAFEFESSDASIATVGKDTGIVTPIRVGNVTITATEKGTTNKASYELRIYANIEHKALYAYVNDADEKYVPVGGSGQFTFVSTIPTTATINANDGTIDYVNVGTTVINVTDKLTKVTSSNALSVYNPMTQLANITRKVAANDEVISVSGGSGAFTLTSSDETVATIKTKTTIDFLKVGTTTITVTDDRTGDTQTFTLTVEV